MAPYSMTNFEEGMEANHSLIKKANFALHLGAGKRIFNDGAGKRLDYDKGLFLTHGPRPVRPVREKNELKAGTKATESVLQIVVDASALITRPAANSAVNAAQATRT